MLEEIGAPPERKRKKPFTFFLTVLMAGLASLAVGWSIGAGQVALEARATASPANAGADQDMQLGLGKIIFPIRRGGNISYLVAEIELDLTGTVHSNQADRLIDALREIALETLADAVTLTSLDRVESRQDGLAETLIRDMNRALGKAQVKGLRFSQFSLRDLQE